MKFNTLLLVLAIATMNMSAPLQKLNLETGFNLQEDMDQCIEQFEGIVKDAENALDMVNNRDWVSVAQIMPQLVGDMLDDYNCFKNAGKTEQLENAIFLLISGNRNTRQCVLDHLKVVATDLRLAMVDLFKRQREEARKRFKHALDTLEDVQNC